MDLSVGQASTILLLLFTAGAAANAGRAMLIKMSGASNFYFADCLPNMYQAKELLPDCVSKHMLHLFDRKLSLSSVVRVTSSADSAWTLALSVRGMGLFFLESCECQIYLST
jgi:hypothetical protein